MPDFIHRHPHTDVTRVHMRSRLRWPDGTVTISTNRRLPMPPPGHECDGLYGFGTGFEDVELGPRRPGDPGGCERCEHHTDCRLLSFIDVEGDEIRPTIRANWELGARTRKHTMGDAPT